VDGGAWEKMISVIWCRKKNFDWRSE